MAEGCSSSEGTPSATEKLKSKHFLKVSPENRAKQFSDDFYADGGVLFCRYCNHCVDFVRVDTMKDHLKSKKHLSNKELKLKQQDKSRQVSLKSVVSAKDLREEFILDFVKMCSIADIPLEKADKMKSFFMKYCKQGGALPKDKTLRSEYVPRLYEQHFQALKSLLADVQVSITADETTDVRDNSILNVLATAKGKSYLIGVVKMESCNNATFSQAIVKTISDVGIQFENVVAFVTDSAAYCKKAYKDILSTLFQNSIHVRCLAHIVNLVAEIFHHSPFFKHTADLIAMIKSSMFKKPGRKSRFLKYLSEYLPANQVKLPPVPVASRWNSWFATALYHSSRVHVYEGFFKAEKAHGMAVERIIELVTHKEIYPEIFMQLNFIKENCQRLMAVLTSLEVKDTPIACSVYSSMEDLKSYLGAGTQKVTFGVETDKCLTKIAQTERNKYIKSFQNVFKLALKKLTDHLDNYPTYQFYKSARVFDPRQLPIVSHDISEFSAIQALCSPSMQLFDEWLIYMQFKTESIPVPLNLQTFWESQKTRFPLLSTIALNSIWMPVTSVDVERSFSQYKHLLDDHRESLTEENTKRLMLLYYNGDIEGRLQYNSCIS